MSAEIYDLAGTRILSCQEVCDLVSCTPQQIEQMEAAGHFPKRLQLGDSWFGWRLTEIQWLIYDRFGPATADPAEPDDWVAF